MLKARVSESFRPDEHLLEAIVDVKTLLDAQTIASCVETIVALVLSRATLQESTDPPAKPAPPLACDGGRTGGEGDLRGERPADADLDSSRITSRKIQFSNQKSGFSDFKIQELITGSGLVVQDRYIRNRTRRGAHIFEFSEARENVSRRLASSSGRGC